MLINIKLGLIQEPYLKEQPITSLCLETKVFYNSNNEIYSVEKIRKDICPLIIR